MAKKENAQMSKEIVKRLNDINVKAKTEEEARKKLLKILINNDIDGMEDETIETLLDIAESLVEDTEPETEEEEANALANEAEEEEAEEEEAEEEEAEEEEAEEEEAKEEEAEEEESEEEESEEEPEEEKVEEKPAKKAVKKTAEKVEKKAEKVEKKAEKPAKKEKAPKRGVKIDFIGDKDEQKAFKKIWAKIFPESEYEYCWITTSGCTIKYKGNNKNHGMVLIDYCTRMEDKTVKCTLAFYLLNKKYEILNNYEIEFEKSWRGVPLLKDITMEKAFETVSMVIKEMKEIVEKLDKKLGDNRKKMEEALEKKSAEKAANKKATKKAVEPEPEKGRKAFKG